MHNEIKNGIFKNGTQNEPYEDKLAAILRVFLSISLNKTPKSVTCHDANYDCCAASDNRSSIMVTLGFQSTSNLN